MIPGIPWKARPLRPPSERGRSRSCPRDAAAKAWPSQTARQWGVWGSPSVQPAGAAWAATTTSATLACVKTCAPAPPTPVTVSSPTPPRDTWLPFSQGKGQSRASELHHCWSALHGRRHGKSNHKGPGKISKDQPAGAAGAASSTRATSAPPSPRALAVYSPSPDGKGKGQSKSNKDKGPGKSKKGRAAGTAGSAGYPGQPSSTWGFWGNVPPRPAAWPPRLDSPYLHEQLSAAALAHGQTVDEYMRDWHEPHSAAARLRWPVD